MSSPFQPNSRSRIEAGLIEAATRHAHDLRRQAIDDMLRRLGQCLSRPFRSAAKPIAKGQPCHS